MANYWVVTVAKGSGQPAGLFTNLSAAKTFVGSLPVENCIITSLTLDAMVGQVLQQAGGLPPTFNPATVDPQMAVNITVQGNTGVTVGSNLPPFPL